MCKSNVFRVAMLQNFLLAAIFLARKPQRVPGWLYVKFLVSIKYEIVKHIFNNVDCRIVLDGRAASDRSDYVFNFKQLPPANMPTRLTDIFYG